MSSEPIPTLETIRPPVTSPSSNEDSWTSINVVAPHLGVSTHVLRKYIKEGRLPAYKFGGRILLKWSDVDALIQPIKQGE